MLRQAVELREMVAGILQAVYAVGKEYQNFLSEPLKPLQFSITLLDNNQLQDKFVYYQNTKIHSGQGKENIGNNTNRYLINLILSKSVLEFLKIELFIIIQLQYLNIKMDSKQGLQKEIRESFELAYKERLLTMKNFYQMRYQTLQDTIANSYRKVIQDQILTTMIRDTTTVNFIEERVKQLFKQIVQNERQVLIQKLGIQYSQLKFHYQQIQKKYQTLKKQSENTQHKNYKQRISTESEKSQFSEVLRKKQQQLFELKLELKEKTSIIKEKQRITEDWQTKLNEAKEENVYLKIKLQKFEQQVNEAIGVQKTKFQLKDVDLQESQKKLSLLQNTMKEMEKVNHQKIELIEKKYRKKVTAYQAKIEQYKGILKEYADSKPKGETHQQYQLRIQQLEKKMLVVSREAEKKVSQYRSQKEKDKLELEKRYQNKYRQLQAYYEKLVEEKIQESERVALEAAQRIKSEEQQIRKYVTFLEENSVPCQEFFSLQKNADSLRAHYQSKCAQMQTFINKLSAQNKNLKINYEQIKKREQEIDEKLRMADGNAAETSNKLKLCQQQISQMKSGEKKFKSLLTDLESNLRSKQEEVFNLRNEVHKIRSQNAEYIGTISERQNQYLQKSQQAEQMERKLIKLSAQIESLKQEEEKKQMNLNNFKRLLMQKQNQISNISQQFHYKVEGLNSQIHKQELVINSQSERIKELADKFSCSDSGLSEVLKQRSQVEGMCRKLELENKFIKQSQEAFRIQHQVYINDFKRKIQEKNSLIDQLKGQINEQKRCHTQQIQTFQATIRKLNNVLRKVHRMYSNEIDNIRRSLKDVKIYVQSIDKLFKSEVKMIEGSAILKIKEEVLIMTAQKNEQVRKLKEALDYEKAQQLQSNKTKSEKLQAHFKEKLEGEIRNFESQIASKQKQIQKMEKERKKNLLQKQELCESIKIGEKKLRQLELAFESEKIQNKSKISEIVRSFDNEKNKIIQDYEDKRQQQQDQISDLASSFKNLRKELEFSKMANEDQKNRLITEQKQFTRKEKQLQRQLEKKKKELQSLKENMETLRENSRKLDFEIRSLIDKNTSLTQSLAQSELKSHQATGELSICKAKIDRLTEENEQIKKQLAVIQQEKQSIEMSKKKMDSQLKQIKYTINRSNKSHELRALQQLDQQTKQLSSKVSQLKKVNLLMSQQKTPLRS